MLSKVTCINNFFSVVAKKILALRSPLYILVSLCTRERMSNTIVSLSSQCETIMVKVVIANSVCVFN